VTLPTENSLGGRIKRYTQVSTKAGGFATKLLLNKYMAGENNHPEMARLLTNVLGDLKGPFLKVAQILSTIPDMLPPEYAQEMAQLQAHAPSMGPLFVRRRMQTELGSDWKSKFQSFKEQAVAAASLGQVHHAISLDGIELACKLQYPDMPSVIEADLAQLQWLLKIYERQYRALDTQAVYAEIQDRLREELDYKREATNLKMFAHVLQSHEHVTVPKVFPQLSTDRLLTMAWHPGKPLMDMRDQPKAMRNRIAQTLFQAWYEPLYTYGVIHGDPHMGNYAIGPNQNLILYDFGCVRMFNPMFIKGIIHLYEAVKHKNQAMAQEAYELWGFKNLTTELIEVLNLWAEYLYAPLLDDRVRLIHPDLNSAQGREVAKTVHKRLQELGGGIMPPREFVLIDRAAVALGSVFMHLRAELNWHQLFEGLIDNFSFALMTRRQEKLVEQFGLKNNF
jgi:predicted unusual protein kinase regulating ubiquinone biosynthesis (AarF/ABC1/UbiB family)